MLATVSESFEHPTGIAVDRNGNLYIADNHRVLKVTPSGTRSTVAENLEPTVSRWTARVIWSS